MLSPAFESASYLPITLLPALSPSPFGPQTSACRPYPRSPGTPRAAALRSAVSSSPYFSPSNPFSARPRPGALSARYTIINTLSADVHGTETGIATPAFRSERSMECKTLRQRGRVGDTPGVNVNLSAVMSEETETAERGKEKKGAGVGKRMIGLAGWVVVGMIFSLGVLTLRARMDAGMGGVGAVKWEMERPVDDVWAERSGGAASKGRVEGSMGELRGIWASEGSGQ